MLVSTKHKTLAKPITEKTTMKKKAAEKQTAAKKKTSKKKAIKQKTAQKILAQTRQDKAFRFFDNREKYLMFVTTCNEKWAVAQRIARELDNVEPGDHCLRIFDAGVGDGTVLGYVMRSMHEKFTHVPWLVVGKEISMEDARIALEKMPDRFTEHPEMVLVLTNMYYSEAPNLTPNLARNPDQKPETSAAALNWHEIALSGTTANEFDNQIRELQPILASDWQVKTSKKTGNPLYVTPSVLVIYRNDRRFSLKSIVPKPGQVDGLYDLVIASQPYRARVSAQMKINNVIKPLARAIAPGGRMIGIQSSGDDPGMEIVNRIWRQDDPFQTDRRALLAEIKKQLTEPADKNLGFYAGTDSQSMFQYHLHTLPSEVGGSIGTSTLMAAWNAAIYVAQVEDSRVEEAMKNGDFLDHVRKVLAKHGGLWFNDESFVVTRKTGA